ncbi:hypothetical protein BN14_06388 [Rhizoctonia solani AG-1 IB]|uniref:Uncharacterized protein n=1 Tax=Thanatephorus cucumeris (strain AG1-IB / isolate 7/3/14) TaxID=1108050 RepID=M5BYL7_THACB|nr:hypothetical protein BN14_06388 [Rhizoctonia solani AG-1 IB]
MVRGIWGSKEKEKEKPKEQPKDKENERPVSIVLSKFPSVPTEDPLPNLPSAPKTQIVSGAKQSVGPSKIAPKAGSQEPAAPRSFPIAPKPRAASGLYAPTAASLARRATTSTTATKSTARRYQSHIGIDRKIDVATDSWAHQLRADEIRGWHNKAHAGSLEACFKGAPCAPYVRRPVSYLWGRHSGLCSGCFSHREKSCDCYKGHFPYEQPQIRC